MRLTLLVALGLTALLLVAACDRTTPPANGGVDDGGDHDQRDPDDATPPIDDVPNDLVVTSIGMASLASEGRSSSLVAFFFRTEPTPAAPYIIDFMTADAACVAGSDPGGMPAPGEGGLDVLVDAGDAITVLGAAGAPFLTASPWEEFPGAYAGTTDAPRPAAPSLSIPGGDFPPFDTPAFPPLRRLAVAAVDGAGGPIEEGSTLRWTPAPPVANGFTQVTFTFASPDLSGSLFFCGAPDGDGAVTVADAIDIDGDPVDLDGLTFELVAVERATARFHVNPTHASLVLLRSPALEFGPSQRLAAPPGHAPTR